MLNGDQFFLDVTVQDIRSFAPQPGVFAAYLDVVFDEGIVAVVESPSNRLGFDIEFSPNYGNGGIADFSIPGLIDEAGAFQEGFNALGPGELQLFRVRFTAGGYTAVDDLLDGIDEDSQDVVLDVLANDTGRSGLAGFSGNPADRSPGRDVTLFDPPASIPDEATEFVGTTIQVLEAGSPVIASVDGASAGGDVRVSADGTHLLYTPRRDFFGDESFTYTLTNGQQASVTVTVDPVNDAPVAVDDFYLVELNETLNVFFPQGVLENDSDVDHDSLMPALVDPPQHGNLFLNVDGSFQYTPETDYSGLDQFRYVVRDLFAPSNIATVTLQVNPPDVDFRLEVTDTAGNPVASLGGGETFHVKAYVRDLRENALSGIFSAYLDLLYSADQVTVVGAPENPLGIDIQFFSGYDEGQSAEALVSGLLDNVGASQGSEQPNGSAEILLFRVAMRANLGTLEDDLFVDVPEDSIAVTLDVLGNDMAHAGTAAFSGRPSASSPTHDVTYFVPREPVLDHEIVFTDASLNIESSDLFITHVGPTSHGGLVSIAADGLTLLYTPATDFYGEESFAYTVGDVLTAQVIVDVTPVNDPPQSEDDTYRVRENLALAVPVADGVLANDRDADADTLVARLIEPPMYGEITFREDGSFDYTPPQNFSGPDQFVYATDDGTVLSEPAVVTLEFDPPPVTIRLAVTNSNGVAVTEFVDGERIFVQAWVQDLRDDAQLQRGLQAAYLDLLYDQVSVQLLRDSQWPLGFEIQMGEAFVSPGNGNADTPGVVDEVGSRQAGAEPLGNGEILLFTVPFESSGPRAADDQYSVSTGSTANQLDVIVNDLALQWHADFVPEAADTSPDSDVLLFDSAVAVAEQDIRYTGDQASLRNDDELQIVHVETPSVGGQVEIAPDGKHLLYTPTAGFEGIATFFYTVANRDGRVGDAQVAVTVTPSWQNLRDPLDVNDDKVIAPLDALVIINDLNTNGSRPLGTPPQGPPYLDVNGDGFVTPLDALLIINYLNFIAGGEGESSSDGRISAIALEEPATASNASTILLAADILVPLPPTNRDARQLDSVGRPRNAEWQLLDLQLASDYHQRAPHFGRGAGSSRVSPDRDSIEDLIDLIARAIQ